MEILLYIEWKGALQMVAECHRGKPRSRLHFIRTYTGDFDPDTQRRIIAWLSTPMQTGY
jgi:hypothetical protein